MVRSPRDSKPKKITVKNNNMKHGNYRDAPPKSCKKRHRAVHRYNGSSNERESSEYVSHRAQSPYSYRASRYSEVDEFYGSRDLNRSNPTYKVLCVSDLHPKASDEQVKETLYRKYREFGEFSVKISHELDERVAYVSFRSSKDAKVAKNSKPRISLFDKIALVVPVYKRRNSRDHHESRASRSQSQICQIDRVFESGPYGMVPSKQQPQVFREIGLPPIDPRELIIPRQPLMHHVAHSRQIHASDGPPRHLMPQFGPFPQPRLMHDKKDKFQNYLHHIPPEDDPLATRTLFAGNLEHDISKYELRQLFGRYGVVEDIYVKRPLPGKGNSCGFVRFQNVDMAYRAKVKLSGRYIGKIQCKIGYGKTTPTQRIWVGGLGPWTSLAWLKQEFDRFGVINKIEFVEGDTCAYIQFESIDAATSAVKKMRGVALGSPEHKLRTDFADGSVCGSPKFTYSTKSKPSQNYISTIKGDLTKQNKYPFSLPDDEYLLNSSRSYRKGTKYIEESRELDNHENSPLFIQLSVSDISSTQSLLYQFIDSDEESEEGAKRSVDPSDSVHTLKHLACKCSDVWQGSFELKHLQYPAKLYLTSGDSNVMKFMMRDEDGKSILRITQQFRLNEPTFEDVSERIMTADMHAIFLAMPYSSNSISSNDVLEQIRPLHNLVTFLKHKDAAGVISLISKDNEPAVVLFAFPPCKYSAKLLKQITINVSNDTLKYDDHLVVVLVSGSL